MKLVKFGSRLYNLDQLVRIKPGKKSRDGEIVEDSLILCFSDGKMVEVRGATLEAVRRMIESRTITIDEYARKVYPVRKP